MKSLRHLHLAFLAILLLAGCQSLTPPRNIEQSIAYAYPAHAVATASVTALLKSNKISVEAAENALTTSRQVKNSLDLARHLERIGKPQDALATLKMAQIALEGLQKFVEESKK